MNVTATCNSEHSWSRRCSTETVLSIQGQETDVARDTSDTEEGEDLEYEPVSEPDEDAPLDCDDTDFSDNDIISTKVIEVSVVEDRDQVFADSEPTDSQESDSEIDFNDYWQCAQCRTDNNNPLFRYCEKCFRSRKNFFPPRPKRKLKRKQAEDVAPSLSQDTGISSLGHSSQELSEASGTSLTEKPNLKRSRSKRSQSVDRNAKRTKCDSESDDDNVQSLIKTVSDPSITIEELKVTKKVIANTIKDIVKEKDADSNTMCFVCFSEPKSGVFVHGRTAHICCCYKCALKVWSTAKRCPICNRKVSNVLKAVIT